MGGNIVIMDLTIPGGMGGKEAETNPLPPYFNLSK
jgi:hypothetical protein